MRGKHLHRQTAAAHRLFATAYNVVAADVAVFDAIAVELKTGFIARPFIGSFL